MCLIALAHLFACRIRTSLPEIARYGGSRRILGFANFKVTVLVAGLTRKNYLFPVENDSDPSVRTGYSDTSLDGSFPRISCVKTGINPGRCSLTASAREYWDIAYQSM
jgi:hypothetical protein